ncbi:hypothetical protein EMCRGX_G020521 [Ephydatia muelleri]|eukprot:Em0016g434a
MAANVVSGSRLSVPQSTERDNASLSELGAKIHAKRAKLRVKNALMRTFGTGWKNSDVEGEVIAKPRKNTRRVTWNIGGQFYETEHGAAFWRNAKEPIVASDPAMEPSTEPQNSRPEANEEDESFNHDAQLVCEDLDEELNPLDALPASSHETGPSDPLLAHDQQWETLQGEHEHWMCLGVLYARTLHPMGRIKDLWRTRDDVFVPPFRMRERFGLARDRFIDWERFLKIWPPGDSDNKWKYIQPLVDAFNALQRKFVEQGTEVVIDESMGKWIPFFENTPEGVPHLSKIIRNPQGIGVECKNVADAQTGIMLFLEIQEGKEAMAGKKYCDRYPKSVALTLRMTEFLHGRGHVVHGDSAFASVATCTALLEHSTYFSGLLKIAHKEFPREFCQEMAFSAQAKRGDTVTIRTEKKVHGVTKYIYGHVWNEPGSEGAPKKIIISTWNHSMSVDDHARKRWHLSETTGESETITRTVPRTQMIKSYFEAACAIDVHNHLRQDGLGMENAIGTSKWWWFRLMYTIFGMIEVDTFKTFCHFNPHIPVPSHRNFIERLVIMLLTNSKSGAPEPTPFQLQLRKRKRNDSGGDEDSDVECAVEHLIMCITQYLNARDSGSKATKSCRPTS